MTSVRAFSIPLLASMLSSIGCYDWEAIRPAEVPKVSGSFATPVAQQGNTTIVAVRVVDVERPDGSLIQLKGEFDVRVTVRGGGQYEFKHPVGATRDGDVLVLRGGNRGETRIPIDDIVKAEASQYAQGKTLAVTTTVGIGVGLIAALLITSSVK